MKKKNIEEKNALNMDISFGGVNSTQKLVFAKHLSVMLKSGLNLSESLDIIQSQATGKMKRIIQNVQKSVQAGNSLASSLSNYSSIFSSLFINAIKAGEASGTLETNLENIAVQLKKDKDLMDKIKGAMVYPIIILGATVLLGLAMAFLVLPKITPLFEGLDMDLPASTRFLISFSHIIETHGRVILFSIVIFIIFIFWVLKNKFSRPFTHYVILHFPIINKISRNRNLATFCRTLATLLKSGLIIDEALNNTKDTVSNYYFKKKLSTVSGRIMKGTKLAENLEEYENYFPRIATSMIKVGEESGNLEESLFYLADYFEGEVENATKSLSTAIEPVLLIVIGILVGGLALSIITPIYQITGNVQR